MSDHSHPDFDAWSGDEPGSAWTAGFGMAYRCLVCDWHGKGGAAAHAHHSEAHHAIGLTYWPGAGPQSFACCQPSKVKQAV